MTRLPMSDSTHVVTKARFSIGMIEGSLCVSGMALFAEDEH